MSNEVFSLRPYQRDAVDAVVGEIGGPSSPADRCQVISACGTGKTLMSQRIADALADDLVVFTAPSIALIDQNLRSWTDQVDPAVPFDAMAVCSDATVASVSELRAEAGGGDHRAAVAALGDRATTDPVEVKRRIIERSGRLVIFVTHASLHVVAEALRSTDEVAQILLVDEAHKTTGPGSADPSKDGRPAIGPLVLTLFPARRRVFFTATPRIYSGSIDPEREGFIACMTDGGPYGRVVFSYRFADAVADGWLVPFKLVVSVCADPALSAMFTDQPEANLSYLGFEATAREIGAHIAVERAVVDSGASSILTFHSTVAGARAFAAAHPIVSRKFSPSATVSCTAMSGTTPAATRRDLLERFAAHVDRHDRDVDRVILSNAKVLTEGVDVPAIDMVAFCDPKQSVVDITQAIGRAMRPSPGKTEGTVVVPVILPTAGDIDMLLDSAGWRQVRDVVAALQSIDDDLAAWFSDARYERGTGGDMPLPRSVAVIGDVPPDIHVKIASKIIAFSGPSWEQTFGELVVWMARNGRTPRQGAADPVERRLGRWVGTQRRNRAALSSGRIDRLESVPGWAWSVHGERWTLRFDELVTWMATHGRCPVRDADDPVERSLASWINHQRFARGEGALSRDRIERLEAIHGWTWRAR